MLKKTALLKADGFPYSWCISGNWPFPFLKGSAGVVAQMSRGNLSLQDLSALSPLTVSTFSQYLQQF